MDTDDLVYQGLFGRDQSFLYVPTWQGDPQRSGASDVACSLGVDDLPYVGFFFRDPWFMQIPSWQGDSQRGIVPPVQVPYRHFAASSSKDSPSAKQQTPFGTAQINRTVGPRIFK